MGRENIRASLVWELCLQTFQAAGLLFLPTRHQCWSTGWLAGRDKGLAIESLVLGSSSALLWARGLKQVAEP